MKKFFELVIWKDELVELDRKDCEIVFHDFHGDLQELEIEAKKRNIKLTYKPKLRDYNKAKYWREEEDMLIRILENDDWIIDYDKERGMYRASYFEDNHFVDEVWFNEYKEKENIVKCKNCDMKHYSESGKNLWCDIFDKIMPEDGYCCFGEEFKNK